VIGPVVDADWVAGHRDEIVLADVRWYLDGRSGAAAYASGHIPGAVFVDLDAVLAAPADPARGRHPLPVPGEFAAALGTLGIGDGDAVVAYDDAGGTIAARLVWMLRAIDENAALLDGGLAAWAGELTAEPTRRAHARFTPRAWPLGLLADADAAADRGNVVLDARAAERYRGELEPVDARAGHIPGARSLPAGGNLDASRRFLVPEALRARFAAVGVGPGAEVISYCGSGVTACHNLLALEHAGLGRGRLYAGSWSQWSSEPGRPAARGEDPG
jgi:thiosulfate/3-mercaptopyruvate sulfurtransferase